MDQLDIYEFTNDPLPKWKGKLKVLELFGGIGSPRKALENLGFDIKHIDYVEIWDWAVLAYNSMFNNNYESQSVIGWNLNVDLLIHGSPCVDFSNANNNDIKSGASMLYMETLDIIENKLNPRPKYIIWENVKGLVKNKKFKQHFNNYLENMEKFGYRNYYDILNAKDFGIPQNRERVFVISIRKDIPGEFYFSKLDKKESKPLLDFLLPLNQNEIIDNKLNVTQPSMLWAIKNKKVYALDIMNIAFTITTKMVRWRNAGVIPYKITNDGILLSLSDKEDIYSYDFIENSKEFTNFYTIPRTSDGKLINGNYNRVWKSTKYVGTLTASVINKIGFKEENKVYFRYLTPLECFRLMGFEDKDYYACEYAGISKNKIYHLAGNSIVVNVLESIFKHLLIGEK